MKTSYRDYWNAGYTWQDYFENEIHTNESLWRGIYKKSRVPDWALEETIHYEGTLRLLVITEDWCGDASNTVPVIARLAEVASNVELRLVKRDENLELMDRHLTGTSRSIPVVIVLDEDFNELCSWGPRPSELQERVLAEKEAGERSMDDIYRDTRRWYALDRGETTLRELLGVITRGAAAAGCR